MRELKPREVKQLGQYHREPILHPSHMLTMTFRHILHGCEDFPGGPGAKTPGSVPGPGLDPTHATTMSLHATTKDPLWNFPGGSVVKIQCFHCRGHRFKPWSGKTPQAVGQLNLRALKPVLHNKRSHHSEKSALQLESSPCSPQLEKSPHSNKYPAQL